MRRIERMKGIGSERRVAYDAGESRSECLIEGQQQLRQIEKKQPLSSS